MGCDKKKKEKAKDNVNIFGLSNVILDILGLKCILDIQTEMVSRLRDRSRRVI